MNFSTRSAAFWLLLILTMTFSIFAQDGNSAKTDLLNKISKYSQSKKPEEKLKSYEAAKTYLAQYGKETDNNTKKVKDYFEVYRRNEFDNAIAEVRLADANVWGREILADHPDDISIQMNLAYGGYGAFVKNKDKTSAADSINYAEQTLAAFDAGSVPKNLTPFKTKDEAVAMMYYTMAIFLYDTDQKASANAYFKAVQYDSPLKKNSYPYYALAAYYESIYTKTANEYQSKFATATTETPEMKAVQENIKKIVDRMLDAYIRAISVADAEPNNQAKADWKTRLNDVYKFRFQKEDGLDAYSKTVLATTLPDPNTL